MKDRWARAFSALALLLVGTFGLSTASADTFGSGANIFTMDFVDIGDAGNANDGTGYGGVNYTYRIGSYEVSEDMITKANTLGGLGITPDSRGADKPATSVSWNQAARFVNWLNTSRGYQAAYNFALQPGDIGYNSNSNILLWSPAEAWQAGGQNLYRHKDAHYFLPSEDEWYKAAYYYPDGSSYFDFATQQDLSGPPAPVPSGSGFGTAVYDQALATGPADITQAGGSSHYATYGQSGNVWEWMESAATAPNDGASEDRAFRGGAWDSPELSLTTSVRSPFDPAGQAMDIGFRVASIPEPTGGALLLAVGGAWLLRRRRR